jgi:M6 family metalloprotease-like protein
METVDGHTIVESGGVWYYARQELDGTLTATGSRVGSLTSAALDALPKHLHPPLAEREEHHPIPLSARAGAAGFAAGRTLSHTQKVLTILVDFSDISFTYSDASFQSLMYGATDSVKEFYLENTYNNFTIVPAAETYGTANDGIVHVTMGTAHPNYGSSSGSWRTVVGSYISAANGSVNFASFDTDGNGSISADELSIVVILAGYENSFGGNSSLMPRIWGHKSTLTSAVVLDGKSISPYTAFGERHGTTVPGTHQATIGIMCHELGHLMLGLPDLYDTDDTSEGIGEWGLMGTGSWNAITTSGDTPAHLSAWCKAVLDITTPADVTSNTNGVSIKQAHANASIKRMWIDNYKSPRGQHFLLENRRLGGYDAGLPGAGLLIWHIDGSRTTNADETRKMVDVEEADGLAHLDSGSNRGDAGDPFPGSSSNTTFNGTSNPNSDDYSGADTGIVVDNISSSAATMTVDIEASGPTGDSIFYNELGRSTGWGYAGTTVWTAVVYDNDTSKNRLDGFEVHINDASAVVDFRLYESMVGSTPTTLLHTQTGFVASSGWNRFLLSTPQSFPAGSTRVIVLKIVAATTSFPASADGLGVSSGRSYIDANGIGAYFPLSDDLAQTALLNAVQLATVYVNFSFTGAESGTIANPFNTFAEGLSGVIEGGTIKLNGAAADSTSSWAGTIDTPLTLTSDPAGSVRLGVPGGGS